MVARPGAGDDSAPKKEKTDKAEEAPKSDKPAENAEQEAGEASRKLSLSTTSQPGDKDALEASRKARSTGESTSEAPPLTVGVDRPDKATPDERAKLGVKEGKDPDTKTDFSYNDRGLVVKAARDGNTTEVTYGADNKPSGVEIKNQEGKTVVGIESKNVAELKVNQSTGEVSATSKPAKVDGQEVHNETRYKPDGSAAVEIKDTKENVLSRQQYEGTNPPVLRSAIAYTYVDAEGKPTNDSSKIDSSKPPVESQYKYDAQGRPTEFAQSGQGQNLQISYKDGKPDKVILNNSEVTDSKAKELLLARLGDSMEPPPEPRKLEDVAPTAAREGNKPNGTFVWKDEQGYHQGQVTDGQLKDQSGKAIGTVDDSGRAVVNGKALNIGDTDQEAAFHGSGSDKARLDLVSKSQVSGFNGVLTSPDGKEEHKVVGGSVYDKSGKFLGHMNANGTFSDGSKTEDINTKYTHWKGRGFENGHAREFETRPDLTNGTVYVQENGQPVKYDVRMGMMIDPRTGEQYGTIKPPTLGSGGLSGGSITRNGQETPLSDPRYKHTVFDLSPMGEGVRAGRNIQGVSLGGEEKLPDGTSKPGTGFVDLQQYKDSQSAKLKNAENELNERKDNLTSVSTLILPVAIYRGYKTYSASSSLDEAKAESDKGKAEVGAIVNGGRVDPEVLGRMRDVQNAERAQVQRLAGEEGKEKTPEVPKLELFKYDPAKTDQVNGAVLINDQLYDIKGGKLYRTGKGATPEDAKEPAATLGPNYTVQFSGKESISLADQNRVLMQYTVGSDAEVHRIVGLGRERVDEKGERIRGGLVDSKQLMAESDKALAEADKGNLEYLKDKQRITGNLAESEWVGIGNRTERLQDMRRNLEDQTKLLKSGLESVFTRALSPEGLEREKVDRYIGATESMVSALGTTGADAASMAHEGKEMQKQFNETANMAALAIVTAPASVWVAGASALGKTAMAGRALVSIGAGAVTSAAIRDTYDGDWNQRGRNLASGAIETSLMLMGPLGAKYMEGASTMAKVGYTGAEAAVQTIGFAGAATARGEHDAFSKANLAGTFLAMCGGHGLTAATSKALEKGLSQYINNDKEMLKRVMHTIQGTGNAATFGAGSSVLPFMQAERERIAGELKKRPEDIDFTSGEFLSNFDYGGFVDNMSTSAAMAAIPVAGASPITNRFINFKRQIHQEQMNKFVPPAAERPAVQGVPVVGPLSPEQATRTASRFRERIEALSDPQHPKHAEYMAAHREQQAREEQQRLDGIAQRFGERIEALSQKLKAAEPTPPSDAPAPPSVPPAVPSDSAVGDLPTSPGITRRGQPEAPPAVPPVVPPPVEMRPQIAQQQQGQHLPSEAARQLQQRQLREHQEAQARQTGHQRQQSEAQTPQQQQGSTDTVRAEKASLPHEQPPSKSGESPAVEQARVTGDPQQTALFADPTKILLETARKELVEIARCLQADTSIKRSKGFNRFTDQLEAGQREVSTGLSRLISEHERLLRTEKAPSEQHTKLEDQLQVLRNIEERLKSRGMESTSKPIEVKLRHDLMQGLMAPKAESYEQLEYGYRRFFESDASFKRLDGSNMLEYLRYRHGLDRVAQVREHLDELLPTVSSVTTVSKRLGEFATRLEGVTAEKLLRHIPKELHKDVAGRQLSETEMKAQLDILLERLKNDPDSKFGRETAEKVFKRMLTQDMNEEVRQLSTKPGSRSLDKMLTNGMEFSVPEGNLELLREIAAQQKKGKVPVGLLENPNKLENREFIELYAKVEENRRLNKEAKEHNEKVGNVKAAELREQEIEFRTKEIEQERLALQRAEQRNAGETRADIKERGQKEIEEQKLEIQRMDRRLEEAVEFHSRFSDPAAIEQRKADIKKRMAENKDIIENRLPKMRRYNIQGWRDATAIEQNMPLLELTKNLKIVDYGFKDGGGKVSLGPHDMIDHVVGMNLLRKKGLLTVPEMPSEGRQQPAGGGYDELFAQLGNPHKTDAFTRDSERFASIVYESRAFSLLPKDYEPNISMRSLIENLENSPTLAKSRNQQRALLYLQALSASDPHGTGKRIRHVFEGVSTELTEQTRKVNRSLMLGRKPGERLTMGDPEYLALIVDTVGRITNSKNREAIHNANLMVEQYLQNQAKPGSDSAQKFNFKAEEAYKRPESPDVTPAQEERLRANITTRRAPIGSLDGLNLEQSVVRAAHKQITSLRNIQGSIEGSGMYEIYGDTKVEITVPQGKTMQLVIKEGDSQVSISPYSAGKIEVINETEGPLPSGLFDVKGNLRRSVQELDPLAAVLTPEQISKVHEFRKIEQQLRDSYVPLTESERQRLVDETYGTGAERKERIVHIVMGPPGSGKSSHLVEPLAERFGAMVIDSDKVKPKINGYADGLGTNVVHLDSAQVINQVVERAIANGDNLVYPQLGRNLEAMQRLIKKFQEQGYRVGIHLADLDPREATRRTFARSQQPVDQHGIRQMVDPRFVLVVTGRHPKRVFEAITNMPEAIGEYTHIDTHVPFGEKPRLIRRSTSRIESRENSETIPLMVPPPASSPPPTQQPNL